jgi:peptidylprolyl isomerase
MRPWRILAAAAALLLASGQSPAPDAVVAQAGDVSLTVAAARRLLAEQTPEARQQALDDPAALTRLVRASLLRALVLQAARAKKWDQNPEIAAQADAARDAVIVDTYLASLTQPPAGYPSEAEVQAAYDANRARLLLPRQYELSQIFIAVPADAPTAAQDDAQHKLHEVTEKLRKRGDFAELARQLSDDHASAAKGGDLGWLREDQLIPAVRTAAAGLQEGAVSEPVRAPDGWHVLKLLHTKPAGPAPLSAARDQLVSALRRGRTAERERAVLEEMVHREPIQIDEIQLRRAVK